jgi:hypothetical protein
MEPPSGARQLFRVIPESHYRDCSPRFELFFKRLTLLQRVTGCVTAALHAAPMVRGTSQSGDCGEFKHLMEARRRPDAAPDVKADFPEQLAIPPARRSLVIRPRYVLMHRVS